MTSEIELISEELASGADAVSSAIDLSNLSYLHSASMLLVVTGTGSVTVTQKVEDISGTLFTPSDANMTIATDFSTSTNGGKDLLEVNLPVNGSVTFHFQESSSTDSITVSAKLIIRSK